MTDKDKTLQRILERMPTPVVIANPVTAKVLWVNQRLADMYGVADPHVVMGTSLFDFIEASQLGRALADLARVVAGQSPPPFTYHLKRADGERAAGQVSSVPLIYQGQPAMLSFVTDVSERERMVRELTESEQRYRLLVESMPSGVVVSGDGGEIMYVNASLVRALRFDSAERMVGRPIYEFIQEAYRRPVREARKRIMLSGESHPAAPVVLLREDDTLLETTASTTVIHWEGQLATQTIMHGI